MTDENRFQRVTVHLTAHGYSPDEAAEIVLFARRNASPDQWIKVLTGVGAQRARFQQALELAFPAPLTASAPRV